VTRTAWAGTPQRASGVAFREQNRGSKLIVAQLIDAAISRACVPETEESPLDR
jgi:hypothetical protein